jgi:hypothetical protein
MYRFLDRPVRDLEPGNQILVWSMRSWVAAIANGRCTCAALGPCFARWRLADLLGDFNMAMFLLNGEGQVGLRFAPPECGHVRDDEAMLLAMFHAGAVRDGPVLQRFVAQLVQPQAEGPFLTAVCNAADMLRRTPVPRNS